MSIAIIAATISNRDSTVATTLADPGTIIADAAVCWSDSQPATLRPSADEAFRVGHLAGREPIAEPAVNATDGECPKPPSPRFPVWKPRYLDGGVFPF
jgi:hypothetical protein